MKEQPRVCTALSPILLRPLSLHFRFEWHSIWSVSDVLERAIHRWGSEEREDKNDNNSEMLFLPIINSCWLALLPAPLAVIDEHQILLSHPQRTGSHRFCTLPFYILPQGTHLLGRHLLSMTSSLPLRTLWCPLLWLQGNMGVTMDCKTSFAVHIAATTQSCRFILHNIQEEPSVPHPGLSVRSGPSSCHLTSRLMLFAPG